MLTAINNYTFNKQRDLWEILLYNAQINFHALTKLVESLKGFRTTTTTTTIIIIIIITIIIIIGGLQHRRLKASSCSSYPWQGWLFSHERVDHSHRPLVAGSIAGRKSTVGLVYVYREMRYKEYTAWLFILRHILALVVQKVDDDVQWINDLSIVQQLLVHWGKCYRKVELYTLDYDVHSVNNWGLKKLLKSSWYFQLIKSTTCAQFIAKLLHT